MAAKIGILAESTVVTTSSLTTVYTVPADKAARIRVIYGFENQNSSVYQIRIGQPGDFSTIQRGPLTAGDDVFSGIAGADNKAANLTGHAEGAGILNLDDNNVPSIITPLPFDYYLSTGDTVKFLIDGSSDAFDHIVQVVGVEDDA